MAAGPEKPTFAPPARKDKLADKDPSVSSPGQTVSRTTEKRAKPDAAPEADAAKKSEKRGEESAPVRLDAAAVPMSAQRLGRYRLCFEIASGGMATVFLARSEGSKGFDKLVALKRIHPHLAKEKEFVDMFLDEARIAARIVHPNVCTVFDFGHVGETYYLAMEYLLGETVARVMRTVAKLPEQVENRRYPAYCAKIIADACEGLHSAHELRGDNGQLLNVVHRDISPHNLFVTYDGAVRVVDFGIARAADRVHETKSGQVKGKYAYMAPEQIRDEGIDRRADVWALGVILWEMLTCRRLFRRGNDPDTILAVTQGPIPSPSKFRTGIPAELDAIVMRALTRDKERRYATARELGRALTRFVSRQAEPIAIADLADWMEELFREEHARRRELVEMARQMGSEAVPKVSGVLMPGREETTGEIEVDPRIESNRPPARSEIDTGAAIVAPKPPSAIDRLKQRKPLAIAAAAAAVVLLVVAVAALGSSGDDEDVVAPETTARETAEARRPEAADVATPQPELEIEAAGDDAEDPQSAPQGAMAGAAEASTSGTAVGGAAEEQAGTGETADEESEQGAGVDATATNGPAETARTGTRGSTGTTGGRAGGSTHVARGPGTVRIATPGGWADIYVNGSKVGRSPDTIQLPAGRHTLVLKPFGRDPSRTERVTVVAGQTARVSVPLR